MKIIKAKVYIEQTNSVTRYTEYPTGWLENKSSIPDILYPQDRTDHGTDEKGLFQILYAVVEDDAYEVIIQSPLTSVPTREEIETYQAKHRAVREVVKNEDNVIKILAKTARGIELNQKEKDVLDPEKSEEGINKSRTFLDTAENDYKAQI